MNKRLFFLIFLIMMLFFTSCSDYALNNKNSTFNDSEQIAIKPSDDTVQFHFIDVGQGDCILIQNGTNSMLIDAGTYESGHKIYKYLTDLNINKLDYFISTHPHDDHTGGASSILTAIDIDTVFLNSESDSSYSFEKFVTTMIEKDIKPVYPQMHQTYSMGEVNFEFLSPEKNFNDTNHNSFVVKMQFGEIKALFTADAERQVEADLIKRNIDISADILKVGHHGSRNASSASFLNAVNPSVAVIQCGKDNSYGHPHPETLDRLNEIDCSILRTDLEGTIVLSTDGKTIQRSTGEHYDIDKESQQIEITYVGNKKSKVLHIDSCPNLPGEKNSVLFSSREEAIEKGYKLCGNCNP